MRTIEIPGGTALLKDKKDLRGRDSKLIKAAALGAESALSKLPDDARPKPGETVEAAAERMQQYLKDHPLNMTTAEGMKLLDLKEAIIVAYLADWSIDLPLPTLETIGDLPGDIYDALDDATGGDVINAAVANTNFDVNPDQKSPTGPSSSSDSSLRAEPSQAPESIPSSLNGSDPSSGEATSTEPSEITTTP